MRPQERETTTLSWRWMAVGLSAMTGAQRISAHYGLWWPIAWLPGVAAFLAVFLLFALTHRSGGDRPAAPGPAPAGGESAQAPASRGTRVLQYLGLEPGRPMWRGVSRRALLGVVLYTVGVVVAFSLIVKLVIAVVG